MTEKPPGHSDSQERFNWLRRQFDSNDQRGYACKRCQALVSWEHRSRHISWHIEQDEFREQMTNFMLKMGQLHVDDALKLMED